VFVVFVFLKPLLAILPPLIKSIPIAINNGEIILNIQIISTSKCFLLLIMKKLFIITIYDTYLILPNNIKDLVLKSWVKGVGRIKKMSLYNQDKCCQLYHIYWSISRPYFWCFCIHSLSLISYKFILLSGFWSRIVQISYFKYLDILYE